MKHKRLGIIGGQGPETSAKFCIEINRLFKQKTDCQPDLVLENLPISEEVEQRTIQGEKNEKMFLLMKKAVERLNKAEVDFMVIPCNTVHVFIDELRSIANVPILSIVEETARVCKKKHFKKIGVLATTLTRKEKLYETVFKKEKIKIIKTENNKIDRLVLKILSESITENDKELFLKQIKKLQQDGAEAIVLGCTDLHLLLNKEEKQDIPLLDTCKVLEEATVKKLLYRS